MSSPESPSPPTPAEPVLSRQDKERLLKKMYGLPHWIAIIRLFAYQTMTMDKARAAIKPIAKEFGKEPTAEACEVLIEIVPGNEPMAKLKSHIKRMAFQILGPEKKEPELPAPVPETEKPPARKRRTKGRDAAPAVESKPVKQPRHFVLKQCEAWLKESGLAYVVVEDVKRTTPAVAPFVASLDFIVLRGDEKLLVTVRPNLPVKHVQAATGLRKLFGAGYRSLRIWPAEGPDGWSWQEFPIDSAEAKDAEPALPERPVETPIMQQYREAKERHPDMLLLFRIGDFFELFHEDAEAAAKLLGLTLTTRDQSVTMAGFPHHQLETYLHKLLKEGKRVAICDVVDESLARGPIRREVKRVVTPDSLHADSEGE